MAAPATLKHIDVDGDGQSFTLHIEDDKGNAHTFAATRDQLDMLADSLDDILLQGDTPDEVKGPR